jgi:hypothetical protein
LKVFESKINSSLSDEQTNIVLIFLEEFLKKTMKFKIHKEIKQLFRDSPLMAFLKPLALKKKESELGAKAYDTIARYFKDIKEDLFPS